MNKLPRRKQLQHTPPAGYQESSVFFITINCRPRGLNQLAKPDIATALAETIKYRMQMVDWWPFLILLMPDHLHGLFSFPHGKLMPKVIADWKRYTARHYGIRWQRGCFDHRIRQDKSLMDKWKYILENPVRAKLIKEKTQWPYLWTEQYFLS